MRIGKLTNEQLKGIVLSKLKTKNTVLLSAAVGEDCAALDFDGQACVLSTDPITGASQNIGALAVHVSANDVASSGARPTAMLVTLLVPPDKSIADIEQIIDDTVNTAASLDIDIIGGHTEVTDAVSRIVISATVIGRIESAGLIKTSGARPGDDIIMTKYAGLEGTYIIAHDHQAKLDLEDEALDEARGLSQWISVLPEGIIGAQHGATAMHDITEGGVFGAVYELCEASGTGCDLYQDRIPILDVTRTICRRLDINPYRLIGSGSMLITTANAEEMLSVLGKDGINAAVIGKITQSEMRVIDNGEACKLTSPEADELFSI